MGKRANNQASKTAAKKAKVDPALAAVMDTVKKAGHLPEQCSAMLASMLPFSLAIASDERLESQQKVVSMAEETLQTVKTEMETTTLAGEDAQLDDFKSKMADLVGTVKEAEATLATKKEDFQAKNAALTEATAVENTSLETLAERQAARATADAKTASMQEDKVAMETAFQTHFQLPMEAGEGPHFKELEPFLHSMDIEKSLHSTLPGTCAKTKETRGSFDDVILEQLEKAISGRISALAESIAAETSGIALLAEGVQEVETDSNSKKEARSHALAEFEAAQQQQSSGEEALVKANEAVTELCPQLEQAAAQSELTKSKLADFESGPLDGFMNFKARTVAPIEAATAGA
jgi:chromosome segregation ATPase